MIRAKQHERPQEPPNLEARSQTRVLWTSRVLKLFLWLVLFGGSLIQGEEQPSAPSKPARIVTRYAITSTHDLPVHDPKSWRLLASNDGGVSWAVLDVRTNEEFSSRQQRRVFRIPNRLPYNIYRLEVNEINSRSLDAFDDNMNVQLADLELMGPTAGVGEGRELQCIASASEAHPLLGPAENAFDNDPGTHWMDLGIWHRKQSWVQCQYAVDQVLLLTNIAQVQGAGRVVGQNEALRAHGPSILADLEQHTSASQERLSGYALTSANDTTGRDPTDWRLLGSTNRGKSWEILDVRRHELFSSRFQRRVFEITNHLPCSVFRLEITATRQLDNMVQLAEIEPLYGPWETAAERSIIVSAKTDNPPAEGTEMAFDADPKTKWLSMAPPTLQDPNWVQWQYIPAQPGLPVVDRHALDRLADELELNWLRSHPEAPPQRITGYALTSADDFPTRDPRDWQLLGSNDGGKTWVALDDQRNQFFKQRRQRKVFTLKTAPCYARYQLRISSVADPASARSVQLAELEPLYGQTNAGAGYSVVATSQAENPPSETSDLLFDGDAGTKWLDFAEATANRSSWVEWHYVPWRGRRTINLDRLSLAASPTRRHTKLNFEGVVVAYEPVRKMVGLLDGSGFQMVSAPSNSVALEPGERVRISGELLLREELPVLIRAGFERFGFVPPAEQIPPPEKDPVLRGFRTGRLKGKVVTIVRDKFFTSLVLTTSGSANRFTARIFDPANTPLDALWNTQVEVQGVFEPVLKADGVPVPGIVWVRSLNHVRLDPPDRLAWNLIPEVPLASVSQSNQEPRLIRVRGRPLPQLTGADLILADGTNQLRVMLGPSVLPQAGLEVECIGLLGKDGALCTLSLAHWRQLEAPWPLQDAAPSPLPQAPQGLTQIRSILDYAQGHPEENFPVTVRGVITYVDLALGDFFISDGTGSIDVASEFGAGISPQQHQEGLFVELKGTIHEGRMFASEFIQVLGRGQMPKPLQHPIQYLMTGRDDGQWVEIEGVVGLAEKQRLTIAAKGGEVTAWVNDLGQGERDRLVGSLVRAQGVCSPAFNDRNQRLGQRLLVPSCEYIQIVQPAPKDRFSIAGSSIESLLQTDAEGNLSRTGLVKIAGILTHAGLDGWFVQDGNNGIRIQPQPDTHLSVGSKVEAVGLVRRDGVSVQLVQPAFRRTGEAQLPPAQKIDPAGEETRQAEEDLDGTRVEMEGILVGYAAKESGETLHLELGHTRRTLYAFLSNTNLSLATIPIGSRLRLAGAYKARTELGPDLNQAIVGFEIFLNDPSDAQVLAHPAWWTPSRFLWALALILPLSAAGLLWTLTIARKNQLLQQTRDELQVAHRKLERRVAERTQELASSLSLLNAALESTADGILVVDQKGTVTGYNAKFCEMWRIPPGLMETRNDEGILKFVGTQVSNPERFLETIRMLYANPEQESLDTLTFRDGRIFERYSKAQRLGSVCVGRVWSFRDVTAQQSAARDVAYERDLLNSLLDNLPDLIYFKDLESRFVRTSRSKLDCAAALLQARHPGVNGNGHQNGNGKTSGWNELVREPADLDEVKNRLIGKTDFDLYPEERARSAYQDEQEIIRTGRPLVGKLEQTWGKSGEALWLLTTKMPWRDTAGNIIGTFGTSKDITAIKDAEAKLSSLHQQLLEASRRAGMAEVATSVLHNVGNVLNSVNVSAGVISQQIRKSTTGRVAKLAELFEGHRHDLPDFLTRDNRTEHLISYLRTLSQELGSEQAKVLSELDGLASNIDHIKDIVARQQSYAKVSGLLEVESMSELVEDALRMHATSLARQRIQVIRDFETVAPVLTDKHQVLQILVNLIRNAAQAMSCNLSEAPTLTIRLSQTADQSVSISVSDNGVGIPPENLNSIFAHGFTTKKDGHGFGLHSGALAAREMGGSLRVQSAGPYQGATFTLELPLRPVNRSTKG